MFKLTDSSNHLQRRIAYVKTIFFSILNDSKESLGYVLPAKHAQQSFDQRRLG